MGITHQQSVSAAIAGTSLETALTSTAMLLKVCPRNSGLIFKLYFILSSRLLPGGLQALTTWLQPHGCIVWSRSMCWDQWQMDLCLDRSLCHYLVYQIGSCGYHIVAKSQCRSVNTPELWLIFQEGTKARLKPMRTGRSMMMMMMIFRCCCCCCSHSPWMLCYLFLLLSISEVSGSQTC